MKWLDWTDEAFAAARERHVPVLLFVKASWCRWCRVLEDSILSDPPVAAAIESDFIPICVDKDRRPDLDPRYTLGGWPTLAWLDEHGEILGADNFLERAELLERLAQVANGYSRDPVALRDSLSQVQNTLPVEPNSPRSKAALGSDFVELSLDIVEKVSEGMLDSVDPEYGGWGKRHKFPHPEALDFALIRWTQTGDSAMLDMIRRTLRKMQAGGIHDQVEGGFYRFATRADWSVPNTEKMLDSNAQRAHIYLEAYQALGDESFKQTAEHTLHWMMDTLLDQEQGAFRGGQDADSEYAQIATRAGRLRRGKPECDPTIFSNWNAMAASTLLKADAVLGGTRWRNQALETIDFLLEVMWDGEHGLYHYYDGRPHLPGMLGDHAYALRALVDAAQYAGQNHYLTNAERLASLTIENLRADDGGFYDKSHDPGARGGLRRRNRSILENSVMAEGLLRLALLTGERDYEDCAREALTAFTGDYKRYGHYVAGYARAVDLLFHLPVVVTIVGPRNSDRTSALRQAALRPYIASRIVRVVDPARDAELFARSGLPLPQDGPRAYVERGRESYADTDDPNKLAPLMMRT